MVFNATCPSPWPSCLSLSEAFITVAGLLTVMLVIVFGNAMVVLVVNADPKLRSQRQNWLLVSLAMADLLVGALVMPLTTIYEVVGVWVLGSFLCEAWLALDVLFVTASILHICIISLDRYWSVTQPLTYPIKRTPTRISTLIGVAWFVSLLICLPPILGIWSNKRLPGECSVSKDLGYVLYSSLGSFYIPVGILVMVYWRIYVITLHHSRQRLKDTQRTDETLCQLTSINRVGTPAGTLNYHHQLNDSNVHEVKAFQNGRGDLMVGATTSLSTVRRPNTINHFPPVSEESSPDTHAQMGMPVHKVSGCQTLPEENLEKKKSVDRRRRLLKMKERQATLLLGLILLSFIACWLPFFIMYVLGAFAYQAPELSFKFFFWLGYLNSAVNPIIYTVFNREFKRALFRLIRRNQHYLRFLKRHIY